MKIYTREGDRGKTRLLSGEKVEKDDFRVNAYGALDELQAHLGLARSSARIKSIALILYQIQNDIFVASTELASTSKALPGLNKLISNKHVLRLERWIDDYTATYGLPDGFVVAGNSTDSAVVHIARAVCRRCERLIVVIHRQTVQGCNMLITYFNRLSDLLFVLAWALEVRAVICKIVQDIIGNGTGKGLKI